MPGKVQIVVPEQLKIGQRLLPPAQPAMYPPRATAELAIAGLLHRGEVVKTPRSAKTRQSQRSEPRLLVGSQPHHVEELNDVIGLRDVCVSLEAHPEERRLAAPDAVE